MRAKYSSLEQYSGHASRGSAVDLSREPMATPARSDLAPCSRVVRGLSLRRDQPSELMSVPALTGLRRGSGNAGITMTIATASAAQVRCTQATAP
jgi:hypothetical protein